MSPCVRVTGRSRSTKKSWKTFSSENPVPSAPACVEARTAMRHVVIESASGIAMVAFPSPLVSISGLM